MAQDSKAQSSAPDESAWEESEFQSSSNRTMIVLVVLFLGLAGAGLYFFAFQPKYVANRIIFAMEVTTLEGKTSQWWAKGEDADWRRWVGTKKAVEKLGLKPIMHGNADPEMQLILDEGVDGPDDLIEKTGSVMDAAWALKGGLTVTSVKKIPHAEAVEVVVKVDITLHGLERGVAIPIVEGDTFKLVTEDEDSALSYAAQALETRYLAPLAVALGEQPEIKALAEASGGKLTRDQQAIVEELEPLFGLIRRVDEQNKKREEVTVKIEKTEKATRMDSKARLGELMSDEYVIGSAGADRVLLMTRPRRVGVSPKSSKYFYTKEYERLVVADNDGKNRKLVLETYNIFSYPDISADGKVVGLVLDHHGWSKSLVALTVPEGAITTLRSDDEDYYSSPEVSPNGSHVAYLFKECRRCEAVLRVIGSDGKGDKMLLDPGDKGMSSPTWGADGKHIYLAQQGMVWKIDVATAKAETFLGGDAPAPLDADAPAAPAGTDGDKDDTDGKGDDEGEGDEGDEGDDDVQPTYGYPVISPDGAFLAVHRSARSESTLAVLNIKDWKMKIVAKNPINPPKWSPDSKRLGFLVRRFKSKSDAESWDTEIAVVPAAGGETKLATTNNDNDTFGGWSGDGKWIFHSQPNREPVTRSYFSRIYKAAAP